MPPIDPFFVYSNYAEAALWNAIGIAFLVAAAVGRGVRPNGGGVRRRLLSAAVTFVAFGWSDVVEAHTGAWWRPWWLLVWKGLCLLALLVLAVRHYRGARRISPQ